jgi:hypothetical protein
MIGEENPGEFLWERGGARIGWFGASGPLATLSRDRNNLRISFGGENFVFAKDRIEALRMSRGLLSGSVYVEHVVPIYPPCVKFGFALTPWSPRFNRIKQQLESLGYVVTE